MGRHGWWMILGCTLPLLLIFFAPALGLGENWGLLFFIGLMFVCHFVMMGMHGGHRGHSSPRGPVPSGEGEDENSTEKEPETHGAH